jgi:predicted secreted hydrolase
MSRLHRSWLGLAATVAVAVLLWLVVRFVTEDNDGRDIGEERSMAGMLSGNHAADPGYARVTRPRPFSFPADHGPHEQYRAEWWYFTGNLDDSAGRAFGYELTFFRFALAPRRAASASRWRTNQLYMAHFAVSDVEDDRFRSFERYSRAALGLAGAEAQPLRIWLYDWSASAAGRSTFPLVLRAQAEGIGIDLVLTAGKPVVLQGKSGFSRKSGGTGQASYYYSFTRMPTAGTIQIDGRKHRVEGNSWMDREWSTSALSKEQAGWDWFALQLSDGRDLMFYRLRRKDGTPDPFSAGTLVEADGTARPLGHGAVLIRARRHWRSPRTGALYPAEWSLRVPDYGIDIDIEPLMDDQELNVAFKYWEGAVRLHGISAGHSVSGRGYVELTGYKQTTGNDG